MKILSLMTSLIFVASCASTPTPTDAFNISDESYEQTVESYSDHAQKYDGPYNLLDVTATLLNSQVLQAQTQKQALMFRWDQNKYQSELQNRLNSTSGKTEVFVSFFTPDRKSGDLLRSETLWKTILKIDGKQYLGKPRKMSLLPVEIKSLYPQHNRWSTGYIISFDTPLSELEKQTSELVITGPVGEATLKFQAVK